jgi:hypothetical protein
MTWPQLNQLRNTRELLHSSQDDQEESNYHKHSKMINPLNLVAWKQEDMLLMKLHHLLNQSSVTPSIIFPIITRNSLTCFPSVNLSMLTIARETNLNQEEDGKKV